MSRYFKATCGSEEQAIAAFHATDDLFDAIEGVTSYSRKRCAESLLWRFDDDTPVAELMLESLRQSGLFAEVSETSEEHFWNARSYPV